jgi:hypothetical protein
VKSFLSRSLCCAFVLLGIVLLGGPRASLAATPVAKVVLVAPAPIKVLGKVLDLPKVGAEALRAAGCEVVDSGGSAFVATVDASITEKAPAICSYTVNVVGEKNEAVYAVPRTVEDAICSLPWMKAEVERHLKVACDIATSIVTRQMLNAATPAPIEVPNAVAVVVAPPPIVPEPSHAKAYAGWGLIAGGTLVGLLGAQLWAADGDSIDADRVANTSGGPAILGLGIAAAVAGGLLVGGVF